MEQIDNNAPESALSSAELERLQQRRLYVRRINAKWLTEFLARKRQEVYDGLAGDDTPVSSVDPEAQL